MEKKGWAKQHRKEVDWIRELTEQEWYYYNLVRLTVVWDKRSAFFGTFDARISIVKKELLQNWANGKICEVKRSLIKKGYLKKWARDNRRLYLTNADLWFSSGKEIEKYIQSCDINLHCNEHDFQSIEKRNDHILKMRSDLTRNKRMIL